MYQIIQIPDSSGQIEYQKIETLYVYDQKTKTFSKRFFNPIVEYLKDCKWKGSEKLDGTNSSVYWDGHRVHYCGRTGDADLMPEQAMRLKEKFDGSEVALEQIFGGKEARLFMECYGGNISKEQNGSSKYCKESRLIGFDVSVCGQYIDRSAAADIFRQFGVEPVEQKEYPNLQAIISEVERYGRENTESPHNDTGFHTVIEGIVCLPAVRIYDNKYNRICVKVKTEDLKRVR